MTCHRFLAALLLCITLCSASLTALADDTLLIDLDMDRGVDSMPAHVSERYGLFIRPELLSRGGGAARLLNQHQYRFLPSDIERRGEGHLTWRGRIRDAVGEVGSATLTIHDQRIRGSINLNGIRYLVSTDRRGRYWMDRVDPETLPPMHPPGWPKVPEGEPAILSDEPPTMAAADGTEVIDVIAFYSENAMGYYSDEADMRLAIRNAVDSNNTALANSGIDWRIRLAGIFPTRYQETGTGNNVLGFGRTDSRIQGLRNDYSADLVAFVTADTDVCGVAWLLNAYRSSWDYGVSMTSATPGCLGGQTLAHELGHNLGLSHDPANAGNPDNLIEPFSYGHFVDGDFRTIMSYWNQCSDYWTCPVIDHFSDPGINDPSSGLPTGTADRNNAEVLRRSMPYATQWREQPAGFADALGEPAADYLPGGDSLWVVQDRITRDGDVAALSGPVYGTESSWLEMSNPQSDAHDLSFYVRATVEGTAGELRVYADDALLDTFPDLPAHWLMRSVSVPPGTDAIRWEWTATGDDAPEEVGTVAMSGTHRGSLSSALLSGQVVNAAGDAVDAVTVVARNGTGDALNAAEQTDDDGLFEFAVDYPDAYPPETVLLSGVGVEAEAFYIGEQGCEGSGTACELSVVGEPRLIAGTVEGLLAGESVTVLLAGGDELRSEQVSADDDGVAEFGFQADALVDYGPVDVSGPGYAISSSPIDSVSVREADVTDLALSLGTEAPSVQAVNPAAGKENLAVTVVIDAAQRESTVTLTTGSGEDATVLEQGISPTGPGADSLRFELTGLDCNTRYEFDIEVVNDHGQSDQASESVTTAACSDSDGDGDPDSGSDSGSGSSCSLMPDARPDPLLGLLLLFALAGLLRRTVF